MKTRYFISADDGSYIGGFCGILVGEEEVWPIIPPGAVEIEEPPEHGHDVLKGFSVDDGKVVGGSWDTSSRPPPPMTPEQRVLAALRQAGAINKAQADAALDILNS